MATKLGNMLDYARGKSAAHNLVARTLVYGTRPRPRLSASHADAQTSALPGAPRSVWKGPKRATGGGPGAPMLRRL